MASSDAKLKGVGLSYRDPRSVGATVLLEGLVFCFPSLFSKMTSALCLASPVASGGGFSCCWDLCSAFCVPSSSASDRKVILAYADLFVWFFFVIC